MQLAATMSTPQQAHKKGLPGAHSAARHVAMRHGIVRDQTLDALILIPTNVSLMMIGNQHTPVCWSSALHARHMFASLRKADLCFGSPVCIGARVHWIFQQAQQRVIAGGVPAHSASCAVDDGGKQNLFGTDPEEQPARTAKLVELAEHEINGLAHSRIGGLLDAFIDCADVTHSNALDEF